MGAVVNLVQAPVDRLERWRTNTRWGDMQPSTLARVLASAADGDVADLVDLIEFVIDTTPFIASLYDSRLTRVLQSEFAIKPNPFGDKLVAKQAADLVSECVARIPDWHQVQRDLLHAIAVGHACGENEWCSEEEARAGNLNYVKRIDFRHGHRFRYDEVWELRLHDRGMKRGDGSMYGEPLIPHKWTIHQYRVQAGYPGIGGVMRACLWIWLFMRMAERWWLTSTERNGAPFWLGEVPKNTPTNVREAFKTALENLASDHVGVVEEGVKILVDATAAATKSYEGYTEFLKYAKEALTLAWLGASDATGPGDNGGRASAETRTGALLDPRMLADGLNFGASLEKTLFKSLIVCNAHRFNVPVEQVPVPKYRYLTLDDTAHSKTPVVVTDLLSIVAAVKTGQLTRESAIQIIVLANPGVTEEQAIKALGPAPAAPLRRPMAPVAPAPGGPPPAPPTAGAAPTAEKAADEALNGAQVTSLLEVIDKVVAGRLPRSTAIKIVARAYNMDDADADDMLGDVGRNFVPEPEPTPFPKAPAPVTPGTQASQLQRPSKQTASSRPSPFAQTIRRA